MKRALLWLLRTYNKNRFYAQKQNVDIVYVKGQWGQSSLDNVHILDPLKSEKNHEHSEFKELNCGSRETHSVLELVNFYVLTLGQT